MSKTKTNPCRQNLIQALDDLDSQLAEGEVTLHIARVMSRAVNVPMAKDPGRLARIHDQVLEGIANLEGAHAILAEIFGILDES